MISVPLIDELRETRGRLADECGGDLDRYAEMLSQVSERIPGQYIRSPLNPEDQRAVREQPMPDRPYEELRRESRNSR